MVRHYIDLFEQEETEIKWELVTEGNTLRLYGIDSTQRVVVISIYRSGTLYRHRNAALIGLNTDGHGRIKQFNTPAQAHTDQVKEAR